MIGRLRGKVIERDSSSIIVDVGGVGYTVTVSAQFRQRVGQRVDLHVHTHVREDALTLFGFSNPLERDVFDALIGVPNIGPVKAIAVLATPVDEVMDLVLRDDAKLLAKLPGIGKKTAQRMLLDLPEKFVALRPDRVIVSATQDPASSLGPVGRDLTSALVNLGFKEAVAVEVAERAIASLGADADLEALLRHALGNPS